MSEDTKPEADATAADKSAEMPEAPERDDKGRFLVESEPKSDAPKPVPAPKPAPKPVPDAPKAPETPAVTISVSALVYRDRKRNSLSVSILQDRLAEEGDAGVKADLRGWFHDHTRDAVKSWQAKNGREATGVCTFEDMKALFAGTKVVVKP